MAIAWLATVDSRVSSTCVRAGNGALAHAQMTDKVQRKRRRQELGRTAKARPASPPRQWNVMRPHRPDANLWEQPHLRGPALHALDGAPPLNRTCSGSMTRRTHRDSLGLARGTKNARRRRGIEANGFPLAWHAASQHCRQISVPCRIWVRRKGSVRRPTSHRLQQTRGRARIGSPGGDRSPEPGRSSCRVPMEGSSKAVGPRSPRESPKLKSGGGQSRAGSAAGSQGPRDR